MDVKRSGSIIRVTSFILVLLQIIFCAEVAENSAEPPMTLEILALRNSIKIGTGVPLFEQEPVRATPKGRDASLDTDANFY